MPLFSNASKAQLDTVDGRLRRVLERAIRYYDFTVLEGHRGEEAQNRAFAKGLSKVQWPDGNHNKKPSRAVDIAPFPIDWTDSTAANERFAYLAGIVMACAKEEGVKLRWGGDWSRDGDMRDETFRDRPHFELDEP
jgi:peptidoglycan L-alanyl-D-glutamate endopeptidase CwlK